MSSYNILGKIEYSDNSIVKGWALNRFSPDEPLTISVIDDDTEIEKFTPCLFRWDLKQEGYGRGYHGFVYRVPAVLQDGSEHNLRFVFEDDGTELERSPVKINHDPDSHFILSSAADLTGTRVLALAASPGDDLEGAGGALSLHTKSGDPVKIIYITNSSKHENEEDKQALKACSILGLKDVEFWGSSSATFSPDPEDIYRLSGLLSEYKPGLIYCPSPHEPGARNKALADTLWRAVQKSGLSCSIAFTELKSTMRVNTLVDITSAADQKKEALSLFKRPGSVSNLSLNEHRSRGLPDDSLYAEGFFLMGSRSILRNPIEKFSQEQFFSAVSCESQNELPLVSIITRTVNREPLLREALSSVVMQTYPNIEVVLVNDGDTDLTELVSEFRKYIDIQYFNPEENLGMARAANIGLNAAKGKYVNFLDDDDLLYNNHVSKLARYLNTTGQRAAFSDGEVGRYEWGDNGFTLKGEKELTHSDQHDLDKMIISTYFSNMLVMCEKTLIEQIGYMDDEFPACEDWDLWIRLCHEVSPERIPGVTAEYRFFADHNYDFTKWRTKVIEKHSELYEDGKIDVALLNRIDKLVKENTYLRRRLAGERIPPDYRPPRNQTIWKILYTLKQVLPDRLVKYIQSKGYRL